MPRPSRSAQSGQAARKRGGASVARCRGHAKCPAPWLAPAAVLLAALCLAALCHGVAAAPDKQDTANRLSAIASPALAAATLAAAAALRPFPRPSPRPASATGPAEPPSTTSKQTSLRDATRDSITSTAAAVRPSPRSSPRPASATGPAEPSSTTSKQTSLRDATRDSITATAAALRPSPRPSPRPASATGPAEPPSTTSKQTSLRDATRDSITATAANPKPAQFRTQFRTPTPKLAPVDAAVQCCLRLVDSLDHVMCRLSVYDEEPLRRQPVGALFANAVLKSSGHQASSAGGQHTRAIGVGVLPVHFKPFDGSSWESEERFRKRAQFFAGIDWSQAAPTDAEGSAEAAAQPEHHDAPAEQEEAPSDSDHGSSDEDFFGDQYEDDCYSD